MKRYIYVRVFGDLNAKGDCSNGGITTRKNRKLVVEHERGNVTEDDLKADKTHVVLELKNIMGSYFFKELGEGRHTMFGGNFVWSSDSRFRDDYGDNPIRVHDRVE